MVAPRPPQQGPVGVFGVRRGFRCSVRHPGRADRNQAGSLARESLLRWCRLIPDRPDIAHRRGGLAHETRNLLVGESARPETVRAIFELVESEPGVRHSEAPLTM